MKLGNLGERKLKAHTSASYQVISLKIQFYSSLVENSQKASLNFFFKSRFSVKPSKFQIYFANDCSSSYCFSIELLLIAPVIVIVSQAVAKES